MVEETKSNNQQSEAENKSEVNVPSIEAMLEAGVHFGHKKSKWYPTMSQYIYSEKEVLHIFDLSKTQEKLTEAITFLQDAAQRGNIIFVGTKRQSSKIVRDAAVNAGVYFVDQRWPGGMLTNFSIVKQSLDKLVELEKQFEEGVKDRTKFEVSQMKKEWSRLNRLYGGIKTLNSTPTAVFVIDANYESGAIKEAKKLGIPVVAIVDSNTNPANVNYVIPGNDDAIKSIMLITNTLSDVIKSVNKEHFVTHHLVDYSKANIVITKSESAEEESSETAVSTITDEGKKVTKVIKQTSSAKSAGKTKGILERVQANKKTTK